MKLDQIAYYAHNEGQVAEIKSFFGLEAADWIEDRAEGEVKCLAGEGRSTGLLRFNYDLGIELEILTYLDGPHWHCCRREFLRGEPFLSHVGIHMDAGAAVPGWVLATGKSVQKMFTDKHTNPYLSERGRTYAYSIFEMPFGPDLKYIWRIEK